MANRDNTSLENGRRAALAGFLYRLAELSFAGLVIGAFVTPMAAGDIPKAVLCALGVTATAALAYVANKTYKNK